MFELFKIVPWIAIGLGLTYLVFRERGIMLGAAGGGSRPDAGADVEQLAREAEKMRAELEARHARPAPAFPGPCPGDEDDIRSSRSDDIAQSRDRPPKVVRQRTADSAPVLRGSTARSYMPEVVTVVVLLAALFVILSRGYGDAEQKWAYGAIGTLLGYWLKK